MTYPIIFSRFVTTISLEVEIRSERSCWGGINPSFTSLDSNTGRKFLRTRAGLLLNGTFYRQDYDHYIFYFRHNLFGPFGIYLISSFYFHEIFRMQSQKRKKKRIRTRKRTKTRTRTRRTKTRTRIRKIKIKTRKMTRRRTRKRMRRKSKIQCDSYTKFHVAKKR